MISLTNIQLRRGAKLLLEDVDITIHLGHRIGITGRNGCGKSSFFDLLLGEIFPEGGDVTIPNNWRISRMAQEYIVSNRTALDYVLDGDMALRNTELAIETALSD